jgi:lipopolysaccharide transport system permease protein
MVPERGRLLYFLNPMAGTLVAFRSSIFRVETFPFWQWIYSGAFSLMVFVLGVTMYRASETQFADKL